MLLKKIGKTNYLYKDNINDLLIQILMRIDKTAYNYHEAPLVILASFFYLFKFIIIAINCKRVLFLLITQVYSFSLFIFG